MTTLNILVNIQVNVGEYEKNTFILLKEVPEEHQELAFEMACTLEAHNDLEIEGGSISDGGYEFLYCPRSAEIVSDEDMQVLEKFMYAHPFDLDEVKAIKGIEEYL